MNSRVQGPMIRQSEDRQLHYLWGSFLHFNYERWWAGDCSLLYMKEKKWNISGYLLKQIDNFIDNFSSQIVNKTISTKITKTLNFIVKKKIRKLEERIYLKKKNYFFKIFLERERKKNCVHSIFSKREI